MKSPAETADFDEFKVILRGIPGYKIATALNFLNNGVDFRGCTKEMMADSWAVRNNDRFGHRCIRHITLDMILAKIEETYPGGKSHMGATPDPVKIIPKKIPTSRELFEEWMTRVRVYADFARDETSYLDMDTDWLWQAWTAGRQS